MKRHFTFLAALLLSASAYCQSTDWLVAPSYSKIEYFAPSMYKVTTPEGKVGMVSTTGKTILEPKYDAINLFYEGRTVFVKDTSHGWRVMGVLNEDGTVAKAEDPYYLFDYQFFSEGYLPVRNSQGQYGYLNEDAKPIFDFIDEEVRPFSEGVATVGNLNTTHWILADGTPLLPKITGEIWFGTNFYNGIAYLTDQDRVWYSIDEDFECKKTKNRGSEVNVDYLYRFDTPFGDKPEYTKYSLPQPDAAWTPMCSGGKWGYQSSTSKKFLRGYEYDTADKFYDGVAIASQEGKYGLLHIVDDKSSFSTHVKRNTYSFSNGRACNCEFQLSIPEKWKTQKLDVVMKDMQTGESISLNEGNDNVYSFSYHPNGRNMRENKSFIVQVYLKNDNLYNGQVNYTYLQQVKTSASIKIPSRGIADANGRCYVYAHISNPSPVEVETNVTLDGRGSTAKFNYVSKKIKIRPYASAVVKSYFIVNGLDNKAWCSVATNDNPSKQYHITLREDY